jgi:MraZ protein
LVGESGRLWNCLYLSVCNSLNVTQFLGEYEVKLDAKGRLVMPAGLLRQLPAEAAGRLVLNRGFEQNLVLYPASEWEVIVGELNKLNPYVKENREFVRYFLRGATPLELDAANRILLPRALQEYASIEKDIMLSGNLNKIELWSKQLYLSALDNEPADFSALAEKVMGGIR